MITSAPIPNATGNRSHEIPSRTSLPHTSVLTRTSSMLSGVADRAAHQVLHQRDLEVVEVERRGALHCGLPGQCCDVRVASGARDGFLDCLEAAGHALDAAAGQA